MGAIRDNNLMRVYRDEKDEAGRPSRGMVYSSVLGTLLTRSAYTYDEAEHLATAREWIGGGEFETAYTYDYDDRPTAVRYGSDSLRVRYDRCSCEIS